MELQNYAHYDVVVIGAGPGGSTLSTLLTREGYRVLLLEREKFPRFHVGESLLPSSQPIWEKLGIAEPMQHLGNTFKYAGEVRFGLDPQKSDFIYSRANFNQVTRDLVDRRPYAYQVERGEFDLFLLNHARQEGVTVVEEAFVKDILWEGERAVGVRWRSKDGRVYTTKAECIADCSGRNALIARKNNLLHDHETIKTSAVFGHFKHVTREPGIEQGFIHTYFIENGWLWFIPLASDVMSVGIVINQPGTDWWRKKSPEEIMLSYINRYQFLRDRFVRAEQCSKVRIMTQLPYYSEQAAGDGWILVGDANFFIDPLFSSGVHVAFHSAEKAASAIQEFLSGKRNLQPFKKYEKWSKSYRANLFNIITVFYQMLKHGTVVENFVKITSAIGDIPFKRRLIAWISGYFEQYYWAIYCACFIISAGIGLTQLWEKIFNKSPWSNYGEFCSEAPLNIPKTPEMSGEKESKDRRATTSKSEPVLT